MSETRTYSVIGMTCAHCVSSVTEEVQEIPGVQNVDITLETGELAISSSQQLDDSAVRAAVEEAGYRLS
jgi:copper chaperone CopZ